jgi:hypothetical protein
LSVGSIQALSASAQAGDSGLYKCQNAQGQIAYSDKPCGAQAFVDSHSRAGAQPEAGPPLGNITRAQLEQMLAAYDTAARRMDVDAVLPFLAEELTIEMVARTPDGMSRRVMRKAEFAKRMRIRAGDISDYSSHRENLQFSITPSGAQAEISSTLVENWRQNGQALNMISDEQYLVELRDGKLQFIAMYQIAPARQRAPK